MKSRDIVVVGGSAGSFGVLRDIISGIPASLPVSLFVVMHLAPYVPSYLPTLLSVAGRFPAKAAQDGEAIRNGRVYVAPPDKHLLVQMDRMAVTHGPKENGFRPSIDALFRSAAIAYGPRVIGVLLSGLLSDGAVGLWAIKQAGGVAIVQSPGEAEFPSMPLSALATVDVDFVIPAAGIAAQISELVTKSSQGVSDGAQ